MTRLTFSRIETKQTKRGKCSKCGKKCQRTFIAWQTLNPFNKAKDGSQKTPQQIRNENDAAVEKQCAAKLVCTACE